MNYILEPKVGAALTNFVNYGSPNKAAEPFIDKDDPRQPADLPAGRRAREAAVPEGHRRGRAQVLRPVDRGQDGLTVDRAPTTRAGAGRARRSGASSRLGRGQPAAAADDASGSSFLLVIPTLIIVGYSLGQRGVIDPDPLRLGQPRLVELHDRAQPRLPADLHPVDRVRAASRRSLCVLLGFPLAYWIARFGGRFRNVYLVLVIIPFLTSYLIRMYAWQFILQRNGLLELAARHARPRRQPRVPQHALRGHPRAHLRLPAVHDPAAVRVDRTHGHVARGGELRPRPRQGRPRSSA